MKPLRVLLLDRNTARREELVALLGTEHQVSATADASTAAESISGAEFDALLLDLDAPDLDLAALRRAISPATLSDPESLEAAERRHIALVLRHTKGNKRRAAHLLGISRSTLLNKVRKYALLAALFVVVSAEGKTPLRAQAPEAVADGRIISGTLSFDGHATVGDFVGTTTEVSGQLTGAGDISAVRGWVQAPVRTIRTGDTRRDKDLNKSMESDKYPDIRFELDGVTVDGGTRENLATTLHGVLVIHGVTRKVALPANLRFSDSRVRVQSDFPLNLKDYRIGGLSKLLGMLKMYEDIEVHVDVLFELER